MPISGADRADVQVALVRGRELLDFRTISSRWPTSGEREGVVYEPDDLNERLDRLRLGGESETVEFKEKPSKGEGIPRTVAAFANGSGGTIIVGIRNGTGEVAGIKGDVTAACDGLHNIVRNNVSSHGEAEPENHRHSEAPQGGRLPVGHRRGVEQRSPALDTPRDSASSIGHNRERAQGDWEVTLDKWGPTEPPPARTVVPFPAGW